MDAAVEALAGELGEDLARLRLVGADGEQRTLEGRQPGQVGVELAGPFPVDDLDARRAHNDLDQGAGHGRRGFARQGFTRES